MIAVDTEYVSLQYVNVHVTQAGKGRDVRPRIVPVGEIVLATVRVMDRTTIHQCVFLVTPPTLEKAASDGVSTEAS